MIKVENLTKNFGDVRAVRDISFEVSKGEVVGFLGPNGAGKTTTMRMLTGFLNPTEGAIEIANLLMPENSLEIRRRIGYLPEDAPLYPEMDVIDYLRFIADMREIAKSDRKARMDEIIELCGIKDMLYRPIGELSRGYRQRVGLAQAMIHNPEILILDEPTSGLDPNQIVEIRDLIRHIGVKRTVMLSTHILSEVQATCDRAIIISNGKIVADNTIEYLQNSADEENRFRLELSAPLDEARVALEAIEGLYDIAIEKTAKPEVIAATFSTSKDRDPRAEIFKAVVDKGWEMLEMKREVAGLEKVFRQLTINDEGSES